MWSESEDGAQPASLRPSWPQYVFLLLFSILAVFSYLFFVVITSHPFGRDFQIYFSGVQMALSGENPYLPYSVGGGFVSHPLMLILVGALSLAGGSFRAMLVWIAAGAVAWFGAFQLSVKVLGDRVQELGLVRLNPTRLLFLIYVAALFAPLHETLYQGQVNLIVVLLLVLFFYASEVQRDALAGVCLGLAIVLKTSPVFLLPFLVILRRFRVVGLAISTAALFTLIPGLIFGLDLLGQYAYIVSRLARAVEPSFYNESILSIAYQSLEQLAIPDLANRLIWAHKAIVGIAHLALLVYGLRRQEWGPAGRFWLFCTYLVLMTISSPLVWYHHSVFLLLPLLALVLSHKGLIQWSGFSILLLIQLERFFEENVVQMGWPVLIAHLLLMALAVWELTSQKGDDGDQAIDGQAALVSGVPGSPRS